jgi:hypothetical protein
MTDHLGLLARLEGMYRLAVEAPERWSETAAAEWATEAGVSPQDREAARQVRRAVRLSLKLAAFWRDPPPGAPSAPDDWTGRVDLALGSRAWRPLLEVARLGLATDPSPELFAEVKERFRLVHHGRWMEGVSYEEWLAAEAS